jgi:hypothetical protein
LRESIRRSFPGGSNGANGHAGQLGHFLTAAAIASDSAGNLYLAGSAVIDPASGSTSAVVAKLDPQASHFLYLTYFDSAASDQVSSMAVDSAGNVYIAGSTTNPNFPNTGGALGLEKSEDWVSDKTFNGETVAGPFFNGANPGQFVVFFTLDVTPKATGKRITLEEVALYTVKNDKITREQFFYDGAH